MEAERLKVYAAIFGVPCDLSSQCPFFRVRKVDEGCVAVCEFTDRVLSRANARKCVELWQECPFYKQGLEYGLGRSS